MKIIKHKIDIYPSRISSTEASRTYIASLDDYTWLFYIDGDEIRTSTYILPFLKKLEIPYHIDLDIYIDKTFLNIGPEYSDDILYTEMYNLYKNIPLYYKYFHRVGSKVWKIIIEKSSDRRFKYYIVKEENGYVVKNTNRGIKISFNTSQELNLILNELLSSTPTRSK